ncbi:endoglucanase [Ceratobasidium sp. AG-Ba]|nr:endoglucanase [Ceratobasidium sp. AG-Ba]QRW07562.1 endoglucanase [Ceratobasidium sp. AG-Ba]
MSGTRFVLLLALHALVASAQNPPNHANSTVSYTTPSTPKYDYAEVLHKSLLFYHAQRSGDLGPNRRLAWRGNSCMDCIGLYGEDLRGGYYEAANTMKWGLPLAWTITQLAFNIHAFPDGFKSVNEWQEAMEGVQWGANYIVNCIANKDQFVGQLGVSARGDTDVDFGYFGPPEEYNLWVPLNLTHTDGIAYINSSNPSSEILGESAAALAATSVIFKDKDQEYSKKLIDHAIDLYTRATTYQGSYMKSTHPNLQTVKEWYPSSIFTDELAWSAAWIYVASGDETYRTRADEWIAQSSSHNQEYSWDEKLPGAYALLWMQTKNSTYEAGVESYLKNYFPGGSVKQTAKGLSFFYSWGSLRYASNTSFIMMLYAKLKSWSPSNQAISFSAQQINYMLGDTGRSWVVGFGEGSPVRPYHKSSYNSFIDYPMRGEDNGSQGNDFLNSLTVNRFILYGALEGGPSWDDQFKDDRSAYDLLIYSTLQVTQDYNAAFTGLNAGMIEYYTSTGGSFKAFSDCGLDLGWSHPNASSPPNWPEGDCYHTCATTCSIPDQTGGSNGTNNTNTGPSENNNNSGGSTGGVVQHGLPVTLAAAAVVGGLFASLLF